MNKLHNSIITPQNGINILASSTIYIASLNGNELVQVWNIACHFYQSTCQGRKYRMKYRMPFLPVYLSVKESKKKVEYSRTNDWMRKIRKSIIMSVESEWIRNNWENTPSKVLGVWYTTLVFLTWHVQGHASAVKTLFPSRPYWTKFLPEPHSWYSAFVKPVLVAATM